MEEDDEDYMSETFILNANNISESVNYKRKSNDKLDKPIKVKKLEEIRRKEGLEKQISCDNKGYNLMVKMGYKPGMGLGKDGSGIIEPIKVSLKLSKIGLGEGDKVLSSEKSSNLYLINYRQKFIEDVQEKSVRGDLSRIKRTCKELDWTRDLHVPLKTWYWPSHSEKKSDWDEAIEEVFQLQPEEEPSDVEKLHSINEYLRVMFSYCYWCGCQYSNKTELESHCPGNLRIDHQ